MWDRVSTSISYVRDMLAEDKELYCRFQVGSQSSQYTLMYENNPFDEKWMYRSSYFIFLVTRMVCFTSFLFRNSYVTMCRRYPKSLGGVIRGRNHSGENLFLAEITKKAFQQQANDIFLNLSFL